MKAYVIVEQGCEYNDEYYYMPESPAEVQFKAYGGQDKGLDEVDRLNGKFVRENPNCVSEDGESLVPFKLVEIEVDAEPIQYVTKLAPYANGELAHSLEEDIQARKLDQEVRDKLQHAAQFLPQFSIIGATSGRMSGTTPPNTFDLDDYAKAKADLKRLEENMQEMSKKAFLLVTRKLFADNQNLKSFSWPQYTPYFNDGDECTFTANIDYVDLEFHDGHEEEGFCSWDLTGKSPVSEYAPAGSAVLELLAKFDNAEYKQMFGDHMCVKVGRNGIETEHIEHE